MQPMLARYGYEFNEEFLLGQWSITQAPPAMRLPLDLPHVSVRGVPYNGPGVAPAWLLEESERPRVCLSLGVTGRLRAGTGTAGVDVPLADLLDMVAEVDAEVVATVNAAQLSEVGRLPDNVRTIDYVPLSLLLPTCSAIVHHGGAGTYATAVAHQVPQLIIPVPKWDEPTLAGHVADRGAGLVVDLEKLSVETMRSQLVRILDDPSFRAGARTLYRESLASPSPRDIVPVLEKLTAQHRA
jgi:UDP:flavonoid glycosyltransferase YjiC (YdhE family)